MCCILFLLKYLIIYILTWKWLTKIFPICSTSNGACGLQTHCVLIKLSLILPLLNAEPLLKQFLAPLILTDFCFPFQQCLALLCIKDSPSYFTIFFPLHLQNIIKGFAGEIEDTLPGEAFLWSLTTALVRFSSVVFEIQISALRCSARPGSSGLAALCCLHQRKPCRKHLIDCTNQSKWRFMNILCIGHLLQFCYFRELPKS